MPLNFRLSRLQTCSLLDLVGPYDPTGNLLSKGGVSYTYPASGPGSVRPHAVTSLSTGWTYQYDANGNMTQRVESGTTYAQEFDAETRLQQVTVGGQVTEFSYDGDGNRVKKVTGGQTTVYVGNYYEKQGTTVTKYYYVSGQRVAMRQGGVVYYLHTDHLGLTSLTTNASGGVVAEQRYYPYGEERWASGTLPTDRRFTGQRWEQGLGLYDYNARWYHPVLGRFVSADTIVPEPGNPQDFNRYSYVRNSPLKYTDPAGHVFRPPERFRISIDISGWNPNIVQALAVAQEAARTVAELSPIIAAPVVFGARSFVKNVQVGGEAGTMVVGNRDPVSANELALEMAGLSAVIGAPASGLGDVVDEATRGALRPGEAGRFGDLDARAVVGDDLVPHHMPQRALGWTPPEDGAALMMTTAEHAQTRTYLWRGATTAGQDAALSFRDVLAADIWDVRSIVGSRYNEGLRGIINYYRTNYPALIAK